LNTRCWPPSATHGTAALFTAGTGFSTHFAALFSPIAGEYGLESKHPDSQHTIKSVDGWNSCMEELQGAVAPELDLIESRVISPLKEFQGVLKTINKTITKRDHKVGVKCSRGGAES
jgi:amphiphysin